MATDGNIILAKTSNGFYCEKCDYKTSKKYNFEIHINSKKHNCCGLETFGNKKMAKTSNSIKYSCENCDKNYSDRAGLWKHKKKCLYSIVSDTDKSSPNINLIDKDDLILELLKQNKELLEIVKNGTTNNSHNTINTNSHNNAFNLNFFLNETCKNAMNITDFIESIKLQLNDLMDVGKLGYVEGISNIIVKNLNALDVTERPVHCTDKKRETFYVKDKGRWEKEDEERKNIKKAIKSVANKNIRLLPQYREKFPDYNDSNSIHSDEHSKIVIESMISDSDKDEKIIKNISKVITIDKFKAV
jgi:hypothetical protein